MSDRVNHNRRILEFALKSEDSCCYLLLLSSSSSSLCSSSSSSFVVIVVAVAVAVVLVVVVNVCLLRSCVRPPYSPVLPWCLIVVEVIADWIISSNSSSSSSSPVLHLHLQDGTFEIDSTTEKTEERNHLPLRITPQSGYGRLNWINLDLVRLQIFVKVHSVVCQPGIFYGRFVVN